jgi:hypothetical protein
MMAKKLERIEEVDLREIFKSEAGDFTPWLAENLDQLSARLGIEIVDPEVEKHVGDFRLDIIGIDSNTRKFVAVENQLEISNHSHLGQLITYSSGVEAGIVVWISPELRTEHQQALIWLNENSDTSFFGVEVRAIRIGDSDPAIDFRVRVAPNDWSRGIRDSISQISPRNELYRLFFEDLTSRYWTGKTGHRKPRARPQNWFTFGAGKSGIAFGWSFRSEDRFSAELYIDASEDPNQNIEYLKQLRTLAKITETIEGLEWEELPERRACRIVYYRSGEIELISGDPELREKVIVWGVDKMTWLEDTFREPIKRLHP